jgi:nucleotide-binding universal stress UspA family protein
MPQRPIIIGFDGTPAAERAVSESAALLAPCPALVVVVWEAGRAFDLGDRPTGLLETPPVTFDIGTAMEVDQAMYQAAQQLAQRGAALACNAGFEAEGLAVADDVTVADALLRIAEESDAPAIVVGAHNHGELRELLLGSTSHTVVRRAPCPVVIVREQSRTRQH